MNQARSRTQPELANRPPHRRNILGALAMFAIAFIVYAPAMSGDFLWDDDAYIVNNILLRSADGLGRIWFSTESQQYYPLVFTSFWIEYQFVGPSPTAYHVLNVALHALNGVLAWWLLRRLGVGGAWAAGALFCLHPINVESVAWIAERKNVLSGAFFLLALRAFLSWDDRRKVGWYVATLLLFVAALLSKSTAAMFPAVAVILLWFRRRGPNWRDAAWLAPMFALSLAAGLFTAWYETDKMRAMDAHVIEPFAGRFVVASRALLFYAAKVVWPNPLVLVYPRWSIDASSAAAYWPVAVVAGLAIAIAVLSWRVNRGIGAAAACFAVLLFPALGFFNVAYLRFSFVADHFVYLAALPPIALVVGGAAAWAKRSEQRTWTVRSAAAVVLIVFGVLSFRHAATFRSPIALWQDTLSKNPGAWMAHNHLGTLLRGQGRDDEVESHFRAMLNVDSPGDESQRKANINLANLRTRQGRFDEAIAFGEAALAIDPNDIDAMNNIGVAQLEAGRANEAIATLQRAKNINPTGAILNNLGRALLFVDRNAEAIASFQAAVDADPLLVEARFNLGMSFGRANRIDEAADAFRRALDLRSDSVNAWLGLAVAYQAQGRREDAIRAATEARRHAQAQGNTNAVLQAEGILSQQSAAPR